MESRTAAARAPTLRALAFLPRMRQLSVKQRSPLQGALLEGLAHLSSLTDLRGVQLELRGAQLSSSVVTALGQLAQLTTVRIPGAASVTAFGFEGLGGLVALRDLDLGCQVHAPEDDGLTDACVGAALGRMRRLEHLSLSGRAGVTAAGLAPFLGTFYSLQHL